MKKTATLSIILIMTFAWSLDSAKKKADVVASAIPEKENGLFEKIKNEFVNKKKKFEEKQKEQEINENESKQEIVPAIVVFGSKENATFIDNDLNRLEMHLHKAEEILHKLSKKVSEKVAELVVDDDIKMEECKSKIVADILHRIYFYIKSVNQAIKSIHTGVVILTSINSIKDESYPIGCDNIIKGLFLLSFTETLSQTIEYEISLLEPCMRPRHQQILTEIFKEQVSDILPFRYEINTWAQNYENAICSKIAREDLKKIFKEQITTVKDLANKFTFFTSFIEALQKYYVEKAAPFAIE